MNLNPKAKELGYQSEEEMIQHLYRQRELSVFEIGLKVGCSENTISRKMKLYDIPLRTMKERRELMRKKNRLPFYYY